MFPITTVKHAPKINVFKLGSALMTKVLCSKAPLQGEWLVFFQVETALSAEKVAKHHNQTMQTSCRHTNIAETEYFTAEFNSPNKRLVKIGKNIVKISLHVKIKMHTHKYKHKKCSPL